MIIAPTPAYYIIRASGEAAEMITSVFSPGSMGDITDVIVLSKEYTNDIEPIHEMDTTIETIREGLGEVSESTAMNPLFFPMELEELDEALEVEQKSDHVHFTAMDGNPFAVKITELKTEEEEPLLIGTVSYQQFELPGYEAIMESRKAQLN